MKTIRLLYSSRLVWLIIMVWMVGLACNAPLSETTMTVAPATESPAIVLEPTATVAIEETVLPFLDVTAPARDAGKIILKSVEPDQNSNVNKVILWLPDQFLGADIVVNGESQTYTAVNPVELNMQGAALAPEVNIVIQLQGQQVAACYIQMANPLYPSGDCAW